ncbi:MAG: ribonuclease H-like domain-containing protein [Nitrospiraceae bacterium]
MIDSTFILLQGVGQVTERRWWDAGIATWREFHISPAIPGLSAARKRWYDEALRAASDALARQDAAFFAGCLRPKDHWRLYPLFRDRALFLDIETTGGDPGPGAVTLVGAARTDGSVVQLIEGRDLTGTRLADLLAATPMLVTFFGSVFDVPFLARTFDAVPTPPLHMDLCFAARRLGLTGGLKQIEQRFDLDRESDLIGLDGWDAVLLWQRWQQGDNAALDRLLRYNRADTVNLIELADRLYASLVAQCGLPQRHPAECDHARGQLALIRRSHAAIPLGDSV